MNGARLIAKERNRHKGELSKAAMLRVLRLKLKRPKQNFYDNSLRVRIKQLDSVPQFEPTVLSEFAAGYLAALDNVRIYGLRRVSANALSGIPK